jgi:exodeoxyribonuclease V beta subunit
MPALTDMTPSDSASTQASIEVLDPLNLPLVGSRLIEASAGTGKTWTIAALYVRLVLGHGGTGVLTERPYDPSQLLVLTFTVAATRELSNRVRERLVEAAACFRGQRVPRDPLLASLLDEYPPGPARDVGGWRLAMAAQAMDDAAVLTIDAWCQRMLREHAFDSGCLFDEELRVDDSALLADAARDYWRQNVYPLSGAAFEAVLSAWSGVEGMRTDVDALMRLNVPIERDDRQLAHVLADVLRRRESGMLELKAACRSWVGPMRSWVDAQEKSSDKGKLRIADARRWLGELESWSTGESSEEPALTPTAWERLTPAGLLENRKAPIAIPVEFQQFAGLRQAIQSLPAVAPAMRLHAAQAVRARVLQLKTAEGSYGFADMLERLGRALAGPGGARLRARILEQYPVAMIDEFQDTSPLQYRLFEQVYGAAAQEGRAGLFLIGDPKQSIYAFRGADIRSYLTARRATAGRHYALTTNFRSTAGVVEAVNSLFQGAEKRPGAGAFRFRGLQDMGSAAGGSDVPAEVPSEIPFIAVNAEGRDERFVSAGGPVPAMTLVHDARLSNGRDAQALFAGHCAERIVAMLGDTQCGFAGSDGFERLRPADIAVLVRTGAEAQSVQAALRRRGLASVYLSDKDSVFGGNEAADLLLWLQAVAEPMDGALARAAFATSTLDHSLAELAVWAHDDEALERRAELMRQLNTVWRRQGVLSMLRQTLHRLGLPGRWLASVDGGGERRLTNFLHLAELLQSASSSLDSHQALIRWLAQEIEAVEAGADEHLVRLESDADLVQIVTIHKSKGLEYSVVLVPFVCSFRPADMSKAGFIGAPREPDGREIVFDPDARRLAAADEERLQEDIRLLYVALTRARHALWVGVSTLCRGASHTCVFIRSGFGYLLAGDQPVAEGQIEPLLRAFAQSAAPHVHVVPAPEVPAFTLLGASTEVPPLHEVQPYLGRFERNWAIGSFSGLVKDVGMSSGARLLALAGKDRQEDLVNASPEVVADSGLVDAQAAPWHRFPRGAMPGNFLHEQLEWLAQERFAMEGDPTLADRLYRRCERQGWRHRAADVAEWLAVICAATLPPLGTSLAGAERIVSEMEFWFPADGLSAGRLDVLCKESLLSGRPRPDLPARELHGMLMGFADLVIEHEGRYWVLDYKSNALGTRDAHYDRDALEAAMAAHRYEVQAVIYLLALHRLLKSRLGKSYNPEMQLGGAVYLFLRGVKGPEAGCYVVPPSVALLNTLDQEMARVAGRAA